MFIFGKSNFKMQKILLTTLCFNLSITLFAQDMLINGRIISKEEKQNLPYVNIGIKKKNRGTVSDENGNFVLALNSKFFGDTLTISFVGFYELNIPVKKIVAENIHEFALYKKVFTLREFEVLGDKPEIKIYGVTRENSLVGACNDSTKSGDIVELGQLIKIGKKNAKIVSAHIFMKELNFDTAIIKINFYKYVNHEPSERLIEERIIKKLPVKNGWLSIEVENFNIYVKDDFILSFEFIPAKQGNHFCYGAALGFGTMFFRENSLGIWEKIPPVAQLSMYVTVKQ